MKLIKWTLSTGYSGAEHEGELEVVNDMSDAEIEELVKEDAYQYLDLYWEVSK
jgi:hypothetical protein